MAVSKSAEIVKVFRAISCMSTMSSLPLSSYFIIMVTLILNCASCQGVQFYEACFIDISSQRGLKSSQEVEVRNETT